MSSIRCFSRVLLGLIALSAAPACSVQEGGGTELGPGGAPSSEDDGGEGGAPELGGGDEPPQPCASLEGTGCYQLENISGNYCWVAAGSASLEECFALDSCDGGLGKSAGCYKWADGSEAPRHPWPEVKQGSDCESFEGTGCYWMENTSGNYCWIPAKWALGSEPTLEECFAMDSCDGGLGQSSGACYKWAGGSDDAGYPW